MSNHGYARIAKAEAVPGFLQSSDGFVVKEFIGSKAKSCCFETLLFHVHRDNRGCSNRQEKPFGSAMWALEATLGNPFPALDKTAPSTPCM